MSQAPKFDPMKMITDHAALCNMSVNKLLITAGMDPSSFHRWKHGTLPNTRTLQKILDVPVPERRNA